MRYFRFPLGAFLIPILVLAAGLPAAASLNPEPQSTALERGYRTGYSDGYNAGYKDVADGANRDFQSKQEYQSADRSYNNVWGPIEDYRDGYQQGFENGYAAGYERRAFNSAIPPGFTRRSASDQPALSRSTPTGGPVSDSSGGISGSFVIPRDAVLTVELLVPLSTDVSQRGDRFQARVVEPGEFSGAIVDGRVIDLKRPGRVKGVAELQLSFEQIRLPDNRSASFRADVVEVVEMGSRDGVGQVDKEGGVKGKDSTKDDVSKVGATTGIGAIIGAIAGGGKGAAIGAVIGGAVGTGGVLSERGKHIRLPRGQQLRIRTVNDTRF